MYKLTTNSHDELIAIGMYNNEKIHITHCANTLETLRKEVKNIYMVAEEASNLRVHLVVDSSEDKALQQIDLYMKEKEGVSETHLIGAFECVL